MEASESSEDVVAAHIAKWTAAFNRMDPDAMASLYSKNAFFFGSNPNLYRGIDGVTAYFTGLPKWSSRKVEFTDVRAGQAADNLVNFAGRASFFVDGNTEPLLAVKMTWVIVREDDEWKIVSHHASSMAPLI